MSLAPEDWKEFMNLSGQLLFGAAEGEDGPDGEPVEHIVNCETGDWVAMCDRNEGHGISTVLVLAKRLAENIGPDGVISCNEHLEKSRVDVASRSGVMFVSDRKAGKRLMGFVPPDDKLNPKLLEEFGKPVREDKNEEQQFVETCFHLSRDAKTEMPQVESTPFACMFDISGNAEFSVFMTDRRDAVGFQIDGRK